MRLALVVLFLAACAEPAPVVPVEVPVVVPAPPVAEPLALPSGPAAITPSLAWSGGALHTLWQEPEGAGGEVWRVLYAQRREGAWSTPVELARGADVLANWADFPGMAVAPDGALVAHWMRSTADAYEPVWSRSTDGGATWTALPSPFPAGLPGERGFVSYAAEAEGLRVFWLDGRDAGGDHHGHGAGATALRTATLTGAVFSAEQVVDARVCDCCATDAVVAGGATRVVYRDRDEAERRDISVANLANQTWTAGGPLGAEGWRIEGCPVNGPAADARGADAVAAWFTGAGDDQAIRAAFSAAGGSFGEAVAVARAEVGARPIGRVDALLDADGTALVLWLSAEGEDGRVRLRRVARDGRLSPVVDLGASSTARAAGFPRLGWDGDRVVAAWTAPGGGNTALTFAPAFVPAVEAPLAARAATPVPTTLPAFEAMDLAGGTVRAADLRGRPLLLNLWATWCEPCRDELPVLQELAEKHPNLRVLAASVDGPGSAATVRKLAGRLAPKLTVLHPDGGLGAALGVSAVPQTWLFDAEQRLIWSSSGAFDVADPSFVAALARVGGG